MRFLRTTIPVAALAAVAVVLIAGGSSVDGIDQPADTVGQRAIEFNRQIRPILSNNCFKCHGPDSAARKAGLRLDTPDGARVLLDSGHAAIVPGDADASALVARTSSDDADFRMPPAEANKTLTAEEIDLLRLWIEQGAEWQEHWSFIPPERSAMPPVENGNWVRNEIDAFILARLEQEGLSPSPEASRETLIRRVTLDLTGLPPTLPEIDAYLDEDAPGAYERVVDRLLASTRYGEHMARYWLDAARFGDTHGLHLDNQRSMWRWRDWVIASINRNMPFDQFTIEQLAGDLLPDPTRDQLIATGFNRNNVTTSEGGAIDAEFFVKYAVDRVETTSTVWMGLTAACATCHDHKFDPITQREFYQLFAFFNNITEQAMDGNRHDPPPVIQAPTPAQEAELEEIRAVLAAAQAKVDAPLPEVDQGQQEWESQWRNRVADRWEVLDPNEFSSSGGTTFEKLDDFSLLAGGENPAKDTYEIVARTDRSRIEVIRLEALTHESLPHTGPGRAENANLVLSEFEVVAVSVADPSVRERVQFVAAVADHSQANGPYLIAMTIDGIVDNRNGWAVEGFNRREDRTAMFAAAAPFGFEGGTELHFTLRHESEFTQHAIGRVRLSISGDEELRHMISPVRMDTWRTVGPFPGKAGEDPFKTVFGPEETPSEINLDATFLDDSLQWEEQPDFADGAVHPLAGTNSATYLHRTVHASSSRSIDLSLGSDDSIRIWLNGHVVLDQPARRGAAADQDQVTIELLPGENDLLMKVVNYGGPTAFYFRKASESQGMELAEITELLAHPVETLADADRERIRRYFRRNFSPRMRELYDEATALEEREAAFVGTLPITLVMQEREDRRLAHVLNRGNYDQPLDEVQPGVPAVFPPLPEGAPASRLGLARWLTSGDHPLTARVTVNRYWQQHFGIGIVRTSEDLGSQGEWPSHPELLDWLATEFVLSGWDVKHLHRVMVTSATYRQSSHVSPASYARDRENRLLARGSRFRLDAEVVRDQALALGGLLVEKIGGPSVKPYQPPGLWKAVAYPSSDTRMFQADTGDALYRRSMYTFWKRTSPPPTMLAFDAPSRETCTVSRARTNTPLQALVLMNDPQFVEAARALAERIMKEAGPDANAHAALAFRMATSRRATVAELRVLVGQYESQLNRFKGDVEAAKGLIGVGESEPDAALDPAQLAAWTTVTSVILGLDEVVTKE